MISPPDTDRSDRMQATLWIVVGLAILVLLYALSPILTPFLLAGILAYICNPVTDRLAGWGLPRMLAVIFVMLALAALTAGLILIILPLLYEEATVLAARCPASPFPGWSTATLSTWRAPGMVTSSRRTCSSWATSPRW